jgi:hypothetical protein
MTLVQFLEELAACGIKFCWVDIFGRLSIRTVDKLGTQDPAQLCPICALAFTKRAGDYLNYRYRVVGKNILGLNQADADLIAKAADAANLSDPSEVAMLDQLLAACQLSPLT